MTAPLTEAEREGLRREIGPPTDRDRKWQPMISAHEVRALLDERDALAAHVESYQAALGRVEALAEEWAQATDCAVGPSDEGAQQAWRSARRELLAALAAETKGASHG